MWLGREGARRLVERKWHGGSRGDGADVFVKDRAASSCILSVSVSKESRIPSPIQICIIASVLRPNVPSTPILSVDQPQN